MKSKSRKLSLIGTIFVSMLSVCSAGVSTFAWFQAQANVNITTSTTSTTISVAKPDEYTFYYFKGNGNSAYTPNGTFSNDFTAVPGSSITQNNVTLWNGIFPTQSMVFAVQIDGLTASTSRVTMQINKFISNNTTKESSATFKRYVRNSSSVEINIGWAIDIYSLSSFSSSAYYTNLYEYSAGSPTKNFLNTSNTNNTNAIGEDTGTQNTITDLFSYSYASTDTSTSGLNAAGTNNELTQTVTLFNNELAASTTMYYFFRVYYSNAASTLYAEKAGDSDSDAIAPVDESSAHRYFAQSSSGTSNCYAGLTFALTDISITW